MSRNKIRIRNGKAAGQHGFTLLEIMIAMFIFAMVLTAIYSTWTGILKGTQSGIKAAQDVQRSRITINALEQSLVTAVVYNENIKWYYFIANSKGDMGELSFVAKLPPSFLSGGRFGDASLRRVSFYTQPGENGMSELVMDQVPILWNTNDSELRGHSITLARDVSKFELEFYDPQKKDWVTEWVNTNSLPPLVHIILELGKTSGSSKPADVVARMIAIPSQVVAGVQAGPGPTPGTTPPGGIPPGGVPPGGYPGGGITPPGGINPIPNRGFQ
ncbi:MAG TPA: prepilin-type N-terminal cleavage/methylation domain-containing protein [Verrucomicrobiae bacterium]